MRLSLSRWLLLSIPHFLEGATSSLSRAWEGLVRHASFSGGNICCRSPPISFAVLDTQSTNYGSNIEVRFAPTSLRRIAGAPAQQGDLSQRSTVLTERTIDAMTRLTQGHPPARKRNPVHLPGAAGYKVRHHVFPFGALACVPAGKIRFRSTLNAVS